MQAAPMELGTSGSEKPHCCDFLKAFHHTGNKLTVQTEVPVLWQLDSPTHNPAVAALSQRFSSCTTTLPSQAFGTPKVATSGS